MEWINFTSNHFGSSFSCPVHMLLRSPNSQTACCHTIANLPSNNEMTTNCRSKLLSNSEIAQMLSTTDCPFDQDTNNNSETVGSGEDLPLIDVFLNPDRENELEVMRQRVEKMEGNLTYTEV